MTKRNKSGPYRDLVGQVFGRLTVAESAGSKDKWGYYEWLCNCECGNAIVVSWKSLNGKQKKSCGCWYNERHHLPGDQAAFNRVLLHYTKHAQERSYCWELTKEEFRQLTSSDCFYCGISPTKTIRSQKKGSTGLPYQYNGIDRVDNTKGYTSDNCVTCCHACNWGKVDKTVDDFYTWIERVYCHGRGIKQ